jgi:tripeptidyl-peptidase-2
MSLGPRDPAELPKEEIGAKDFISSFPQCDGRGVIVGVFDTGVDPGAPGLATTTDGERKMLDLVDCTGSGDVDTSATAKPNEAGELVGLSGRKLVLPSTWPASASGEYQLGVKALFELYPGPLIRRIKEKRRKVFDESQREAVAEARSAVETAKTAGGGGGGGADDKKLATKEKKAEEEERAARVRLLEALEKDYDDVGPIADIVSFKDGGGVWRVCVDTSEAGKLDAAPLLCPFRLDASAFARLDEETLLNFSVDVSDGGRLTTICCDAGSHGTHVAGIIGAHFAETPELNGVAPGCQIIGFKIGDTRLDGMETGSSLVRALGAAIERGVQVVNLSYGEYATVDNDGRFKAMCELAVHKHGIVFVTSAGNNGPALTTGGAPGTSACTIPIGAFVSSRMAGPQYSLRAKTHDLQYTWSSRGPTSDGGMAVSVSAPGGAVAPVPNWTLQGRQLMNGTSMAAPNATGGIALILSSLVSQGLGWSECRVRRAIEVTALKTANSTSSQPDVWALGEGLLQVGKAHAWMVEHKAYRWADTRFVVSATTHNSSTAAGRAARGVYLREPQHSCGGDVAVDVFVKPTLHEDAPNTERVALDLPVELRRSAHWLSCASTLALTHGGKGFQLKVSPQSLPPGAHYAEVSGHDLGAPASLGALFRLPITVIKPHADLRTAGAPGSAVGCTAAFEGMAFSPGHVERRYVVPPTGATWCTITLTAKAAACGRELASSVVFFVAAQQVSSHKRVSHSGWDSRITFGLGDRGGGGGGGGGGSEAAAVASRPPSEFVHTMACVGGATIELALAQFWSSLGETDLSARIEFYGVDPSSEELLLDGRQLYSRVELVAPFRRTPCEPNGSLTQLHRAIRPHDAKCLPPAPPCEGCPGVGDMWPGNRRIYDYLLSYKFSLSEACEVNARFPSLNSCLYESPYEAQLFMLFDANKRVRAAGDFYDAKVKLTPGDYELRLQVRHDQPSFLERLKAMPCVLQISLAKPVGLECSWARSACLGDPSASKPEARRFLEAGTHVPLFVATPKELPALAAAGDTLVGAINYAKYAAEASGAGKRPGGWRVVLLVPPKEVKAEEKPEKTEEEKAIEKDACALASFDDALRALRIEQLKKIGANVKSPPASSTAEEWAARYDVLLHRIKAECTDAAKQAHWSDVPPLLPLLTAHLNHVEALKKEADAPSLEKVVAAAAELIDAVDTKELAAALGVGVDKDDPRAVKTRERDEQVKKLMGEALHLKAKALLSLHKLANPSAGSSAELAKLDAALGELRRWVPNSSAEHWELHVDSDAARGHYAKALVAVDAQLTKEGEKKALPKAMVSKRLELLEKLGWAHWEDHLKNRMHIHFPHKLPPPFAST